MAQEGDPTYPMQRGSGVHGLVLGNVKVVGYPGAQRRGKEYDAFVAAHPDTEILTAAEFDKARRMADAVLACKLAEPYLKGVVEDTLLFRWMGLDCRATPDVRGDAFLTELKTAASAEPTKFTWQALRMAYHAQMRMQQIACKYQDPACREMLPCVVVVVESEAPHPVTVFEIDKRTLEIGEKLLMTWAERLKNCEASGTFPPYCQSIYPLMAPEDLELEYGDA